jgi:hypothetical protein
MTDETDDTTGPADESAERTAPEDQAPAESLPADEKHATKHAFREGVAKAVGYTVEVASILGQQGGDAVKAEREVAQADTEEFIDRMDGEG